ncbi:MAG: type II toxin-antitoxin system RelE/ParE family toxin [Sulfuricella sp.]|nr:type II toxin-antitoxin system RelE/ParE family toxin [Sulfuricella sp.]
MPRVILSAQALRDLERLRDFLRAKNPLAARRAAATIIQGVRVLDKYPHAGRPEDDMPPEFRELVIDFGDGGYVAKYRYHDGEPVYILSIFHQKEAGS